DLFLAGDAQAQRRLGELRAELEQGDHLAIGYVAGAIQVMLAIRAGRLAEAEQLAQECAERGEKAGHPDAAAWHGAHLVTIRWYEGRLPEMLPVLDELVAGPGPSTMDSPFAGAYAVAAAMAGNQPAALRAMATLREPALTDLPRSGGWLVAMNGFVWA